MDVWVSFADLLHHVNHVNQHLVIWYLGCCRLDAALKGQIFLNATVWYCSLRPWRLDDISLGLEAWRLRDSQNVYTTGMQQLWRWFSKIDLIQTILFCSTCVGHFSAPKAATIHDNSINLQKDQ